MSEETKYLVATATLFGETDHKNVGSWKSGLFDCFKYGVCHKALLCACCAPTILLAQVSHVETHLTSDAHSFKQVIENLSNNLGHSRL
jgi:hypothetical protein